MHFNKEAKMHYLLYDIRSCIAWRKQVCHYCMLHARQKCTQDQSVEPAWLTVHRSHHFNDTIESNKYGTVKQIYEKMITELTREMSCDISWTSNRKGRSNMWSVVSRAIKRVIPELLQKRPSAKTWPPHFEVGWHLNLCIESVKEAADEKVGFSTCFFVGESQDVDRHWW